MSKKDLEFKAFFNSCNQQLKFLKDKKWSNAETERLLIIDSLEWIIKNKRNILEEFKNNVQIKNEKPSFYLLLDEKDEITLIINTGKIIARGGQRIVSESIAFQKNKLYPFVTLESKNEHAEIALEGEIKLSEKFSSNQFVVPIIYGDKVSFSPRMFVLNNLLESKHGRIPTQGNMLWMIYSLIKGVDTLNSNGLLHNDLKKENILVEINKNGNFCSYLADMGSAALKSDHSIRLLGNFDNMAFDNPVLQPLLKNLLDLDNMMLNAIRSLSSTKDGSKPYKNLQTIEDARKVADTEIDTYETLQFFLKKRDAKILEVTRGFEPSKDYKSVKPFDIAYTLERANESPTIRYMLEFVEKNNIEDIQFQNEYLTEKDDVWSLCSTIKDLIDWYETVTPSSLATLFIEIRDQLNLNLTSLEKDRDSIKTVMCVFLMTFNNMLLDTSIPERTRQEYIQVFSDQSKYYNVELSFLPQTEVNDEQIEEKMISNVKKYKSKNIFGLTSSNPESTEIIKYKESKPTKDKPDSTSQFGKFYKFFNTKKKAIPAPNTPSPA